MTKKLYDALSKKDKQSKPKEILGLLGIPLNGRKYVEVPNRGGFVYVRLRDNQNEVIQAYNNKVSPVYDLAVVVVWEGGRNVVKSVDTQRYGNIQGNNYSAYLPRHGNSHSFNKAAGGGGDIVWVDSQQIMPLLAMPSGTYGGPNVYIAPMVFRNVETGVWMYMGNTGTQSFLPYIPNGSDACMALVYMDVLTGNPGIVVNSGTYFSNALTGTNEILPYIPQITNPNWIPDAAIRLVTGTSAIGWDNIYDVRQFVPHQPTGTTFFFQSEGIPLGTASTLNVVGTNYGLTISGSTARLFITGSIGGGAGGQFAVVSSDYTESVLTGTSPVPLYFNAELVDDDDLVSLAGDNLSIVFNQDGWYSVNLVVQYAVDDGNSLAADGYFNIEINNTGASDNAYLDVYTKTGEVHNYNNKFMNCTVDMTANDEISIEVENHTGYNLNILIQELRVQKL
jgi:hypothetical protein